MSSITVENTDEDFLLDEMDLENEPKPPSKLDLLKGQREEYHNSLNKDFLTGSLYKKNLFKYNQLNNFIKEQGFKGYIYVNITKNNIIYTLTDNNKNVLITLSPRKLKFKKTGRVDFYLTELVGKCIAQIAIKLNIDIINVVFNGSGKSRQAAISAFKQNNLKIVQIIEATPIPHNGCRPRKPKRR